MKPDFSYKLTKRVLKDINTNSLIRHGDFVITGLSGGADSVCLILLLDNIRKYIDFDLHAIHVNHGIRGEAALHDETFSMKLCKRLNIPFKAFNVDVPELSKKYGLTLEEAGRNARYECFQAYADDISKKLSEKTGHILMQQDSDLNKHADSSVKLALAHHMDDQAETVIFNMVRGSGLKGMGGMEPLSKRGDLTVIRPLLFVSKEEIVKYLDFLGQEFCTDETNFSNDYSRNLIRNEVIPSLNKIQPQSAGHISDAASELREAEDYIHKAMLKLFDEAVSKVEDNSYAIDVKKIKNEEPIIVRYLIIHVIKQLVTTYKDITRTHVKDVYSLILKGKGKQIMLPFNLSASRIKDAILITRKL